MENANAQMCSSAATRCAVCGSGSSFAEPLLSKENAELRRQLAALSSARPDGFLESHVRPGSRPRHISAATGLAL